MLMLAGHTSTVYALAFSPDGSRLRGGAKDGTVFEWDEAGEPTELAGVGALAVNAIAFDPTGRTTALAGEGGWSVTAQQPELAVVNGNARSGVIGETDTISDEPATAVRFLSPDLLVVGLGHRVKQQPGALKVHDLRTGKTRTPVFRSGFGVRSLAVHPPSQRVAWGEWGGREHHGPRLSVWDIAKPDPLKFPVAHTPLAVAFHPDGHLLAAASEWGFRLFDLERKQERAAVRGHTGTVTCLAVSPDGRALATGSWDGTVKLWDAASGAERGAFQWRIGKVFAVAYSPDGLRLAAGGDTGAIVVWDAE